ncbi:hypothetical protein F2Q69_00006564 [Brassica cretica]|uniref:Uncharacterized protein n=1 Tax=Brassica cretica TaxID=69181 RepID=A0A8S9PHP2_BRACR|nr:hypothetical protein F2Q69_00006564 [Brassica cretica]
MDLGIRRAFPLAKWASRTDNTVQLTKWASWIDHTVQLAHLASWTGHTVQLAHLASWTDHTVQLALLASWTDSCFCGLDLMPFTEPQRINPPDLASETLSVLSLENPQPHLHSPHAEDFQCCAVAFQVWHELILICPSTPDRCLLSTSLERKWSHQACHVRTSCWGQNRSQRNQRQNLLKKCPLQKEKDSHDKSPRKVTQGLGQRILDSKTPLVQLAEGASWTGFTDQLAHSASWISPTRRTGKFEATMTEPGAGKELNGSDIEEEHDELNQIDTQGVMGLAGDDTFQSNQDMDPFCLSKGPVTRSQTRRLKKSIAVSVYYKPHGNQAKEPSQLFTYSVFGLV